MGNRSVYVTYFGFTNMGETVFSHMKISTNEYRATLSDDHLEQILQ